MKIVVIGPTGSGKSVLVNQLSQYYSIPEYGEIIPKTLKWYLDSIGSESESSLKYVHDWQVMNVQRERTKRVINEKSFVMERPPAESMFIFGNYWPIKQDYEEICNNFPYLDLLIILKVRAGYLEKRIRKRNRPGEKNYSFEFIKYHVKQYEEQQQNFINSIKFKKLKIIDTTNKGKGEVFSNTF